MKFPKMHEIRFLTGEIFLRAAKKYGFFNELLHVSRATSRLQETIADILEGDRSPAREVELISRIGEVHITLAAVEIAMRAQNDVRTAIDASIAVYADRVLKK